MPLDAVIVGAGVTGLSIAKELFARGYKVGIVARDLPEDAPTAAYASPWAGCNWCSFADHDKREQEWDRKTYIALKEFAKQHPDLVELTTFFSYDKETTPEPWFRDLVEDYGIVTDRPTGPGMRCITYKSFIMHAPNYLLHLARELRDKGITILRHRLSTLDEAYDLPQFGPVPIVINASGLGARALLGVKDTKQIYPIRGQTVLVHAPGVKTCYMQTSDHPDASTTKDTEIPEPTYIIPRPGPEGHVILGGSFQVNNWEYTPDYELAKRILQKNYELCPALAGPNGKSWEDIEIVGHNVGFRPGREGGARLDLDEITIGGSKQAQYTPRVAIKEQRKVAVVQAYGIGPAGYQASIGYAHEAADMVEAWYKKKQMSKL